MLSKFSYYLLILLVFSTNCSWGRTLKGKIQYLGERLSPFQVKNPENIRLYVDSKGEINVKYLGGGNFETYVPDDFKQIRLEINDRNYRFVAPIGGIHAKLKDDQAVYVFVLEDSMEGLRLKLQQKRALAIPADLAALNQFKLKEEEKKRLHTKLLQVKERYDSLVKATPDHESFFQNKQTNFLPQLVAVFQYYRRGSDSLMKVCKELLEDKLKNPTYVFSRFEEVLVQYYNPAYEALNRTRYAYEHKASVYWELDKLQNIVIDLYELALQDLHRKKFLDLNTPFQKIRLYTEKKSLNNKRKSSILKGVAERYMEIEELDHQLSIKLENLIKTLAPRP